MAESTKQREPSKSLSRRVVFGTPTRAGVYDEIIHGHPDAWKGYLSIRMRFFNSSPRVVSGDGVSPVFMRRAESCVDSMIYDDQTNTTPAAIYERIADAIVYGAVVFEAHWISRGGSLVPSLCHIPLSSISRWELVDGRLAVIQKTDDGQRLIPPQSLIRVTPFEEAGPEGIGALRPLVFPFELWKQTLQDLGVRMGNEAGALIVTQNERVSEDAAVSARDLAGAIASGTESAGVFPHGFSVSALQLPAASNPLEVVEYCDQKIRALFDDTLRSLVSSNLGSRALGDSVSDDAQDDERSSLEYCISAFGRAFFHWVAAQYGYNGQLPTLTTSAVESIDISSRVDVLTRAQPLIGWRDDDRAGLRDLLGLEPVDDAGPVVEVSPRVSMAGPPLGSVQMAEKKPPDFDRIVGGIMRLINGRNRDEAGLRSHIWRITRDLRARVLHRLREGARPDSGEIRALRTLYIGKTTSTILAYAERRRKKAEGWGEHIRSHSDIDESESVRDDAARNRKYRDEMSKSVSMTADAAHSAARTIVDRVIGEAEKQVTAFGGDVDKAEAQGTRITPGGLAVEAASVGHRAEQIGRLEGVAAEARKNKMVVVGVWRVSMKDGNRCEHCGEMSGTYHPIEDGLPQVPDPECAGGADRCRCGLVPKLVQRK